MKRLHFVSGLALAAVPALFASARARTRVRALKTMMYAPVVLALLMSGLAGSVPARADVRGDFRLAIIRVEYSDTTPLYTEAQLRAAAAEMSEYFSELSYRNLRIIPTVAVIGTFGREKAYYWPLCDPAKPEDGLCATADFARDIAQIAALGGGGINFTKIDGIMIVSSFIGGDVTIGPVAIDRPKVKGTFQVAYDFERPPSAPLTAMGPSGVYWGFWAHELGHMLQFFEGIKLGGKWNGHPSAYNSGYALLDSCYPTGPDAYSVLGPLFMTGDKKIFNGWLPDSKVSVVGAPASGIFTTTIRLRATSLSPYTSFNSQVIKLPITEGYYYLVESRLRTGVDALPTTLSPSGLWDEGVRISLVEESADPPVRNINACDSTVAGGCVATKLDPRYGSCFSSPTPGYCWPFQLFHPGDKFRDLIRGVTITVDSRATDGFVVTIDRTPGIIFADLTVAKRPPLPPLPGFSASGLPDRQMWIDNPCNGFEADVGPAGLRYGSVTDPGLVAGDDLCLGEENRLYARIENRGTAPAHNVRVHFDLGDPAVADPDCPPQQQQGCGGWFEVGTADSHSFPALATLSPGQSATVWVPVFVNPPAQLPQQAPPLDAASYFSNPAMRVRIDPADGEVSTGDNLAQFCVQHQQILSSGGTAQLAAPLRFTSPFADDHLFMLAAISDLPTGASAGFGQYPEVFRLAGQAPTTIPLVIDLPANLPPAGSRYRVGATVGTMIPIENDLVPDQPGQGHGHADFHVVAATTVVLDVVAPAELQLAAGFRRQSPGELETRGRLVPNHANTWITLRYTNPQGFAATKRVRTDGNGEFWELLHAAPNTTLSALWAGDLDHAPAATDPVVPVPIDTGFDFNDCQLPPGASFPGAGNVGRIAADGTANNCVVHLTDSNQGSAYGVFSVPGPVPMLGNNVDNIHVHWRSLVGGDSGAVCTATQFGRPGADGYSMSWGADLPNPPSYGNPAEEGGGTGLSVTVDTFDNGGGEAPGLEIKWRGSRVAFDNINSDPGLAKDFLRKGVFVEADLTVDPAGHATFTYDGRVLIATLDNWVGVGPGGGCIMFGARTGGACDNHWIDDLLIESQVPNPPFIVQQPGSQSIPCGGTATFTVVATSPEPLNYQWQYNGMDLPAATQPTLSLGQVQSADAGTYRVRVSNRVGSVTSAPATLTAQPGAAPRLSITLVNSNVVVRWPVSCGDFDLLEAPALGLQIGWMPAAVSVSLEGANYVAIAPLPRTGNRFFRLMERTSGAIPLQPPTLPLLEFSEFDTLPIGATDVTDVPWREIPGSLTDELETQVRFAAEQSAQVRGQLGQRFAYIETSVREMPKGANDMFPSQPLQTRVTFFSHSYCWALLVDMSGTEVVGVTTSTELQPPEGADEVAAAVALARADARLAGNVQNLIGGGLLVRIATPNQPGFGHRVIDVTFSRPGEARPRYTALVDLMLQEVISVSTR